MLLTLKMTKKKLVRDLGRVINLNLCLVDLEYGGVIIQNESKFISYDKC